MKLLFLQILLVLTTTVFAQTPRGRVQIKDGTLVTDKGTLLRGAYVSIDTPWDSLPPREYVSKIKKLGLNCIHLYAEHPEFQTPGGNVAEIDSLVKWTKNDSLYLILTMAGWSSRFTDFGFVTDFWGFYAPRYKDETHVIYEIVNEPYGVPTWPPQPYDSLTMVMERSAYDTIRKYAPDTHVQLMSYAYTNTNYDIIQEIKNLGEGIDWKNASVAAHGYVVSSEKNREFIKMVQNAGYAITITENPVIRYKDNAADLYANLAFLRVLEEESVSYINFISVRDVLNKPYLFKSKIESSEIRWHPDFGSWPESLNKINYISPYKPLLSGFCDVGSGINYYDNLTLWYISTDGYVAFNNLDFESGADSLLIMCSSEYVNSKIEIHLDSINGSIVGECPIPNAGRDNVKPHSCPLAKFEGVHNIFMVFKGGASIFKSIVFTKPGINAHQPPYHGIAFKLPGKIEAEDYDIGTQNSSYFDGDLTNTGMIYRFDDVDIESAQDTDGSFNVGWIKEGEWLEYTVNCTKTSLMDIQFRIAGTKAEAKMTIKLDNKLLGTVYLPNTGGWQNWQTVTIESVSIPEGENQILRLEFLGSGFNLNWLNFVSKPVTSFDNVNSNERITFYPNPAKDFIKVNINENTKVEIFTMQGLLLIKKQLSLTENIITINELTSGSYVVKIVSGTNVFSEILIIE